jgi:hypothetical protein
MNQPSERLKLLIYGCEDWTFEFRLFETGNFNRYLLELLT